MSGIASHPAPQFDVAVVGSGIVGLGHALAAVRRGLSVVVIDRSAEITGASVRNFGHLCFTPQAGQAREFALASREIWLSVAADAGIWLRESGTFVIARHDDELQVLSDLAEARSTAGHSVSSGSRFGSLGESPLGSAPLGSAPRGSAPLGDRDEVEILTAAEAEARIPVAPGSAIGGAFLPYDLQADPRQAAGALAGYLARRGVEFHYRTAVTAVSPGRVDTTRGTITATTIFVAVNHDIDQLYPEVAERRGIRRCGLDMLRVDAGLRMPLAAPLLTGWSLVRYGAFNATPAAAGLRERLDREHPELAALDLNQMYTQLPDGSLIVGDTHYRGEAITPFQSEHAFDELLRLAGELFGVGRPRVLERWQGVYASAPDEFLIEEPEPGVHLVAATTGIGMTCGLGLAEHVTALAFDSSLSSLRSKL